MISFKHKGNFNKTHKFLQNAKTADPIKFLRKYGEAGVKALSENTPKDTGLTSMSWYYEIVRDKNGVSIQFLNSNIQNGIHIAVVLQYGHATRNGGWIEGRDYINPAVQPIFDKITHDAWREVTRV